MDYGETALDSFTSFDRKTFDIHIWEAKNPKIVFLGLHGALAHAGDFVTVGTFFKKHGISTVSYDLRGHKQTRIYADSLDTVLQDNNFFLDWVKRRYPKLPIIVVGHSFGGLLAFLSGLRGWSEQNQIGWMEDDHIKGFIVSSPYLANVVKVSKPLLMVSGVLSKIIPKGNVPMEDLTDKLTRDQDIYKRHLEDEKKGVRAKEVSMRYGRIFLDGQNYVAENIERWSKPLLAFVSGDDKLADPEITNELLKELDPEKTTIVNYPENYHENFNELNREDTFKQMLEWVEKLNPSLV